MRVLRDVELTPADMAFVNGAAYAHGSLYRRYRGRTRRLPARTIRSATCCPTRASPKASENSNFLLHTTSGSYILTLYEKRVDKADLPFFLGLMEHLAGKGISCPLPVHRA